MSGALAVRAVACPGWRWLPGMLAESPVEPVAEEWAFLEASRVRVREEDELGGALPPRGLLWRLGRCGHSHARLHASACRRHR